MLGYTRVVHNYARAKAKALDTLQTPPLQKTILL